MERALYILPTSVSSSPIQCASAGLPFVRRSWPPTHRKANIAGLHMVHIYVNLEYASNRILPDIVRDEPNRGIPRLAVRSACSESILGTSLGRKTRQGASPVFEEVGRHGRTLGNPSSNRWKRLPVARILRWISASGADERICEKAAKDAPQGNRASATSTQ